MVKLAQRQGHWGTVVTFPTLLWIGRATCPDAELKTQEDTKERKGGETLGFICPP